MRGHRAKNNRQLSLRSDKQVKQESRLEKRVEKRIGKKGPAGVKSATCGPF